MRPLVDAMYAGLTVVRFDPNDRGDHGRAGEVAAEMQIGDARTFAAADSRRGRVT